METVQLFITCLIDILQPQIGEAVVRVLRRSGVDVSFPKSQTCCGQPAFNAGLRSEARKSAKHTIRVFEKTSGPVVIPSGSCTSMIRHGYLELFAENPEWLNRAKELADRTFEFTEFLVDYMKITWFDSSCPGKLTYHPSCHLRRGLGIDRQPRLLLKNIKGVEIIDLPHEEDCCGFGGVFSVKHPEISAEILKRKINNISDSEAPIVVVCDTGCLLHMAGGLHRMNSQIKVNHIAEILAEFENTL
jgi:L-lactate dehydrogenase complex protein LldE